MQPARSSGAHDPAARPTREVLLATKVCVPHPRPGLVPRQRLVERLVAGTQRELVVVCGPAGFGKSSLLADWAHRGQRTVAWLSLDEDDNDPSQFWRHVAASLDVYRPGVADQVAAQLGAPSTSSFKTPITVPVADDDVLVGPWQAPRSRPPATSASWCRCGGSAPVGSGGAGGCDGSLRRRHGGRM
jgi:hypothetical protein